MGDKKKNPDTLPADFQRWDAPASPSPDTLPSNFSGFSGPPRSFLKPNSPEAHEADAAKMMADNPVYNFMGNFNNATVGAPNTTVAWDRLKEGAPQLLKHPLDSGGLILDSMNDAQQNVIDRAYTAQHSPGIINKLNGLGLGMAAALPGIGPALVHVADQMDSGDVSGGLGSGAGVAAMMATGSPEGTISKPVRAVGTSLMEHAPAIGEAAGNATRLGGWGAVLHGRPEGVLGELARPIVKGVVDKTVTGAGRLLNWAAPEAAPVATKAMTDFLHSPWPEEPVAPFSTKSSTVDPAVPQTAGQLTPPSWFAEDELNKIPPIGRQFLPDLQARPTPPVTGVPLGPEMSPRPVAPSMFGPPNMRQGPPSLFSSRYGLGPGQVQPEVIGRPGGQALTTPDLNFDTPLANNAGVISRPPRPLTAAPGQTAVPSLFDSNAVRLGAPDASPVPSGLPSYMEDPPVPQRVGPPKLQFGVTAPGQHTAATASTVAPLTPEELSLLDSANKNIQGAKDWFAQRRVVDEMNRPEGAGQDALKAWMEMDRPGGGLRGKDSAGPPPTGDPTIWHGQLFGQRPKSILNSLSPETGDLTGQLQASIQDAYMKRAQAWADSANQNLPQGSQITRPEILEKAREMAQADKARH